MFNVYPNYLLWILFLFVLSNHWTIKHHELYCFIEHQS